MKGAEQMFSSARTGEKSQDEWCTPRWLFDKAAEALGVKFDIDAAASDENALAPIYYTEQRSAFAPDNDWAGNVWCNPPYSMLKKFAALAVEMIDSGRSNSWTFLIPARTDTIAFHTMAARAESIYFLKGRVAFVGAAHGAPFPSAIVHLRKRDNVQEVAFVDWRDK